MTTILQIDSSAKREGSTTRQLTAHAVQVLIADEPKGKIVYRDLARQPLPHIDAEYLAAIFSKTPPVPAPAALIVSDTLIAELLAADTIVIGAPMYNFNIPTTLKVWLDYVCRAGKTFRYTSQGPEGLVKNKKVILVVGTGGVYSTGSMTALDHVVPYMKQVLGFMGMTDVTVVCAEKQGMGPEAAASEISAARAKLDQSLKKAA